MAGPRAKAISLFDRAILTRAALDSLRKLAPADHRRGIR